MTILKSEGRDGLPAGFLELPGRVYAEDPGWIPEDSAALAAAFSGDNAYFVRSRARCFCIPGKARVVAFFDPELVIDGQPAAYLGYYESTGDADAHGELLLQAERWLHDLGAQVVYGPVQFNTAHSYRFRLSSSAGFAPFLGEPYNPESYPRQWEELGYTLSRRFSSQIIPLPQLHQALSIFAPLRESLLAEGYRFEIPTVDLWVRSLPSLHEMIDSIFAQNFAYSRSSYASFAALLQPAIEHKICQKSSVLVFAPDGTLAALGLSYPHYGPLVVQGRGRARIDVRDIDYRTHAPLLATQSPRGCIGKTLGVHPAHRKKGIKEVLLLTGFERSLDTYDVWCAATMREDNSSRRVFAAVATSEHWYGLFSKPL
ncbi:MAG TPA: hypothetical protein PKI03_15410 [Pseudomonadota bacterium]|nr:hypothetical protein [Pseudomonadota bacterium]